MIFLCAQLRTTPPWACAAHPCTSSVRAARARALSRHARLPRSLRAHDPRHTPLRIRILSIYACCTIALLALLYLLLHDPLTTLHDPPTSNLRCVDTALEGPSCTLTLEFTTAPIAEIPSK